MMSRIYTKADRSFAAMQKSVKARAMKIVTPDHKIASVTPITGPLRRTILTMRGTRISPTVTSTTTIRQIVTG
jgi:hypothetical protein